MFARSLPAGDEDRYLPAIRAIAEASGNDPDQAEQDARALTYIVVARTH